MWTRIYLTLVAIRLYFALSPSYIHPDENFQGPEVIAGKSQASTAHHSRRTWLQSLSSSHDDATAQQHYQRLIAPFSLQAKSSRFRTTVPGNSLRQVQYAASSHYGPFTASRWRCCGGSGRGQHTAPTSHLESSTISYVPSCSSEASC